MADAEDKVKISARIVGHEGRNLKEVLENAIEKFKTKNPGTSAEVGGHKMAAGCLIEKDKEESFLNALKKELEVEIVKV